MYNCIYKPYYFLFYKHWDEILQSINIRIHCSFGNIYTMNKRRFLKKKPWARNLRLSITQTFIKKDGDVYRTIHDKLFDYLAFYFGSVMIGCFINNATSRLIRERFLFERKRKSDEFIIIVPENYKEMYIKRMIDDWSRGNGVDVFSNINTENKIFTKRFLAHIRG